MTRIDAAPNPFHAAMQGRHDASANTSSGWLQGQRIAPAPTGISLADAAEELSLHMAQAAEEKHHSERKVTAERPMLWLDAAQLAELFSHTHDPDAQAKLEALTAELLRGRGAPMQLAAQAFTGVTQQYLALQHALQRGEHEDAAPHALEALRDALADLELAHGPEIRAGITPCPRPARSRVPLTSWPASSTRTATSPWASCRWRARWTWCWNAMGTTTSTARWAR